jgi:GNAT superfamily N-acetyltransferase
MTINVRTAQRSDVIAIAGLLPVLGYPASEADVTTRLAALQPLADCALHVAEVDGKVAGLCQVQGVRFIASDGYAEIHALVVARSHQRRGVGSALVKRAIEWALHNGYQRVRLRSGVHRKEAHRFYESLGFARSKASFAFEISN